jgi:hypothetical protein
MRYTLFIPTVALGVGLAFCAVSTDARADLTFTLTTCNSSLAGLGCVSGDYGTITLHQVNTNVVSVDVDLATNVTWASSGLAGFEFNLSGVSGATLSSVSALWTPQSGAPSSGLNGDGMGTFNSQLDFTGTTGTNSANLDFTLTATGLTLASFTQGTASGLPGSPRFYFAADICVPNASGRCTASPGTGLVGAGPAAVPGPVVGAGLPGLLAACAGLVAFARRRRHRLA